MKRTADISKCGNYRWTLTRVWDDRPMLLVVMFNPSTATAEVDDPTISLLCWIASHAGYGGFTVVNMIPLRSPVPDLAIDMVKHWDKVPDWAARDALQNNLAIITTQVQSAGAILIAWGALASHCPSWAEQVLEEIEIVRGDRPLYCLGVTKAGYPLHPMARGKRKLPKNAPLIPWRQSSDPRREGCR